MNNKIIINVGERLYEVDYIEYNDDITYIYSTKVVISKNTTGNDNSKSDDLILNFDAKQAKSLSKSTNNEELSFILNKIKEVTTDIELLDNRTLHIYEKLKESTLNELKNRGFKITNKCDNCEFMINFMSLKYIIEW